MPWLLRRRCGRRWVKRADISARSSPAKCRISTSCLTPLSAARPGQGVAGAAPWRPFQLTASLNTWDIPTAAEETMIVQQLQPTTASRMRTIAADDTVQTAAATFADHHVGLLVVCAEDGRAIGVVSKSDLVRHLASG